MYMNTVVCIYDSFSHSFCVYFSMFFLPPFVYFCFCSNDFVQKYLVIFGCISNLQWDTKRIFVFIRSIDLRWGDQSDNCLGDLKPLFFML